MTPWDIVHQALLSSTMSCSLLKFMSIESVMLSNHLILYHMLTCLAAAVLAPVGLGLSDLNSQVCLFHSGLTLLAILSDRTRA